MTMALSAALARVTPFADLIDGETVRLRQAVVAGTPWEIPTPAGELWEIVQIGPFNILNNFARVFLHDVSTGISVPLMPPSATLFNSFQGWRAYVGGNVRLRIASISGTQTFAVNAIRRGAITTSRGTPFAATAAAVASGASLDVVPAPNSQVLITWCLSSQFVGTPGIEVPDVLVDLYNGTNADVLNDLSNTNTVTRMYRPGIIIDDTNRIRLRNAAGVPADLGAFGIVIR